MVEAAALWKSYGRVEAVRDVSFRVNSGEIVGLLGPNGAGKTTIMKILTGYHYPTSGTATVNGMDVTEQALEVKRCLGYLPENAPLYGDLTVREYLDFVADARLLSGQRRRDAFDRTLAVCGLDAQVDRPIDQLSKGFKQRVGLAQAIIHEPAILILDEPTTGLDPNQIQDIRRLIRALGEDKTVILSTHILQEVEAVCNRVLILHEGRIAAAGTTEEIGREMKGNVTYTVRIPGSRPGREALSALGRIGSISEVDEEGETHLLKVVLHENSTGEDIYRWAVAHDLPLRELVPERYRLEDIFSELTVQTGDTEGKESG
jgi:ABC-2 type transport system ATP-binding protein